MRPGAGHGHIGRAPLHDQSLAVRFTTATYSRRGSSRRLGHGAQAVGTFTPGTTERIRLDGMLAENAIDSVAVAVGGCG